MLFFSKSAFLCDRGMQEGSTSSLRGVEEASNMERFSPTLRAFRVSVGFSDWAPAKVRWGLAGAVEAGAGGWEVTNWRGWGLLGETSLATILLGDTSLATILLGETSLATCLLRETSLAKCLLGDVCLATTGLLGDFLTLLLPLSWSLARKGLLLTGEGERDLPCPSLTLSLIGESWSLSILPVVSQLSFFRKMLSA